MILTIIRISISGLKGVKAAPSPFSRLAVEYDFITSLISADFDCLSPSSGLYFAIRLPKMSSGGQYVTHRLVTTHSLNPRFVSYSRIAIPTPISPPTSHLPTFIPFFPVFESKFRSLSRKFPYLIIHNSKQTPNARIAHYTSTLKTSNDCLVD